VAREPWQLISSQAVLPVALPLAMESLVHDVPQEPYLELRSKRYDEHFVVDIDTAKQSADSESPASGPDDPTAPVVLAWKNVCVHVGKKQLLHNLKGTVTAGLYAIMGPSGSGKTTLINTLACRLDRVVKVRNTPKLVW
jgi:ABC-type multidrug transport system fused ATPase/permease subunit